MTHPVTFHPCAGPNCANTVARRSNDRRKKEYCSPACKQKAYRLRVAKAKRNKNTVTFDDILNVLDTLTADQRQQLLDRLQPPTDRSSFTPPKGRPRPEQPQKSLIPTENLRYWRKARGVVHIGVSRNVTFCGKDVGPMTALATAGVERVCLRCQNTKNNHTWWHNYRLSDE